jgi:hypothetical protein
MEIFLDKRTIRLIRQSAADAVEDGDTETLREDVVDAVNEEQIEEIERRIDGGDFYDFMGDTLEEWDGDDIDELFELLEAHFADVGIELKYRQSEIDEEEEDTPAEDDEEAEEDDSDFNADEDDDMGDPLELDDEASEEEDM